MSFSRLELVQDLVQCGVEVNLLHLMVIELHDSTERDFVVCVVEYEILHEQEAYDVPEVPFIHRNTAVSALRYLHHGFKVENTFDFQHENLVDRGHHVFSCFLFELQGT